MISRSALPTRPLLAALLSAMLSALTAANAPVPLFAQQGLEQQLLAEPAAELARAAREGGDPARGAILFFQNHMACAKCHVGDDPQTLLGPDLSRLGETLAGEAPATDEHLVEALLAPSQAIRKGFETVVVVTADGRSLTGQVAGEREGALLLRDAGEVGRVAAIPLNEIEERKQLPTSLMPAGQVNQLASRQQFLDLLRYLIDIRDGGARRALELRPDPALLAEKPLPEYEARLDHAGLLRQLDRESLKRGESIYLRVCANCHGTREAAGSLPTALRFAEGKFKNGSDPWAMYQTLTRGFGFMTPQNLLVPRQKYEVIHYIRETYLKQHNPSQYVAVDASYLERLPRGDTFGPEPSNLEPWVVMDYGDRLINTYEVPGAKGSGPPNLAYKGIAARLDRGAGGVSRGQQWSLFDHDTLRLAAFWQGEGFIDWNGIHFNGRHGVHPKLVGHVLAANPVGPGWAHPETGSFDDPRLRGRDDRPYGPLPRDWARYRGLYQYGERTIVSYTVGATPVLESTRALSPARFTTPSDAGQSAAVAKERGAPFFARDFHIGPRPRPLTLLVATTTPGDWEGIGDSQKPAALFLGPGESADREPQGNLQPPAEEPAAPRGEGLAFGGTDRLEVAGSPKFNMTTADFTLLARIRPRGNGTLFSQAAAEGKWIPNGKTFFLRGGRLAYDIGWVGVVQGKTRLEDDRWRTAALVWRSEGGAVELYVDGKLDARGTLAPKGNLEEAVLRLGYSATNFPNPSHYTGDMAWAAFHQRALTAEELARVAANEQPFHDGALAAWDFRQDPASPAAAQSAPADRFPDLTGNEHAALRVRGEPARAGRSSAAGKFAAGVIPADLGLAWRSDPAGRLLLDLPAGEEPLRFSLWLRAAESREEAAAAARGAEALGPAPDLTAFTRGGTARRPQEVVTTISRGSDEGPFAVDILTPPEDNPWLAQTRLTGIDFFPGGDRAAVCAWDGDVWIVSGLSGDQLTWRRIANGLFQPLGVKLLGERLLVSCRDQIVELRDLNGDREIDFYQCFNNDHQVTEHFHEFAMGLQADAAGNLYYAKSARHALPALVPHHGTLLRVSPDGERTEILANGFRAANGVCLNPDGSFIVTDQEGHWNPKNRINWVTLRPDGRPNFYGNMFGYHDVTDSSDDAMVPPLCWITNAFDRSPAELLWVESERWGNLNGKLLNLSYGNGKVFIVPHESVPGSDHLKQGGMCPLPLPAFPTGVMRGRFHPGDGHLYLCGMFAWAGSATQPGGFYRIRATGEPAHVPLELRCRGKTVELVLSDPIDPASAVPENFAVQTWALKRTAGYGSKHHDERRHEVAAVELADDRRTLRLTIPELHATWGMEIRLALRGAGGEPVERTIHNSIHQLGE